MLRRGSPQHKLPRQGSMQGLLGYSASVIGRCPQMWPTEQNRCRAHTRAWDIRSQGQPLPSWRGLRRCVRDQCKDCWGTRHPRSGAARRCGPPGRTADVHTHERGTLAGASPAVVAQSSDALRESRCVGAQVHTPERGACSPRLQGSSPCSLSNAKMSTMHQHCEHALLTPRPSGLGSIAG